MKIFVDANILIAVLNKEYPLFSDAARILSLHGRGKIRIYTSPLCLAIAFYFASKKSGEKIAKQKIDLLCQNIRITSIDEDLCKQAISNPQANDFEDALEYYSARHSSCESIITENITDFFFSKIPVYSCQSFLNKYRP